jgi:hypothetical protein
LLQVRGSYRVGREEVFELNEAAILTCEFGRNAQWHVRRSELRIKSGAIGTSSDLMGGNRVWIEDHWRSVVGG